ncbi:MAG: Bax inhibitor-1/YccA family protein [Zoogloeaceae bacterium]|jgi:modulator of FtsH protease|nr:Bax inhibitor-1/YccA family protein [Zoogloeaceae bacterium]
MQTHVQTVGQVSERALQQNRVLRNTYLLLALSLIPTAIGAFVGVQLNFSFMAGSPLLSFLLFLAVAWGLMWGIQKNKDSGLGVALLLGFTFLMGVMLGPILQVSLGFRNGAALIFTAAAGTSVIFFALAGIATVTKKDFSFMGKFLFIGLILVLLAMVANIFLQLPALSLTISVVAVLIFSAYILYDVSRIVTGGETNYIMATLSIYLDIYNLFVHLLRLLLAFAGERD